MQSNFKYLHKIFQFCVSFEVYFSFYFRSTCQRKWQNLRENFHREHAKISNRTTGSEAPDNSPLSAWKYYKQVLFLVDMFPSRKLQTSNPSVPSQASEPADDNNQEDEYGMADDSIIDAELEVSNTSGDTQEAEIVGAAQIDPPAGSSMEPFKKPNIQMKRETLKSDANS